MSFFISLCNLSYDINTNKLFIFHLISFFFSLISKIYNTQSEVCRRLNMALVYIPLALSKIPLTAPNAGEKKTLMGTSLATLRVTHSQQLGRPPQQQPQISHAHHVPATVLRVALQRLADLNELHIHELHQRAHELLAEPPLLPRKQPVHTVPQLPFQLRLFHRLACAFVAL